LAPVGAKALLARGPRHAQLLQLWQAARDRDVIEPGTGTDLVDRAVALNEQRPEDLRLVVGG
jgi:hypothetical protein